MRKQITMLLLFAALSMVLVIASDKPETVSAQHESLSFQNNDSYKLPSFNETVTHAYRVDNLSALHQEVYVLRVESPDGLPRTDYDGYSSTNTDHISAQSNTPYY